MPLELSDDFLYDTRLIERHISSGLITREAVEKRRAETPDMSDHAESIDLEQLSAASARSNANKS